MPAADPKLYALLDIAFPGMAEAIPKMEPLGAAWHENSTAFVSRENDEPIAHVGVLEIDLIVAGEQLRVPGIHAVCTHPDHRGRGHARTLMERALAHVDERFEISILFADVPAMYEKFGFRTLPQSRFRMPVEPVAPAGAPLRSADLDSVHAMLAVRTPVSTTLGCVRTEYMFFCDLLLAGLGMRRVKYAPDLDAYLVYVVDSGALMLLDVVARELPSLEQIIERTGEPIHEVRFGFTPDRFVDIGETTVESLHDDIFMVRGPWPDSDAPFRFPYLAHC